MKKSKGSIQDLVKEISTLGLEIHIASRGFRPSALEQLKAKHPADRTDAEHLALGILSSIDHWIWMIDFRLRRERMARQEREAVA